MSDEYDRMADPCAVSALKPLPSARYRAVSQEAMAATLRAKRSQSIFLGLSNATSALLTVGVAVTAGWFALRGQISVGELITVIGLAQFLLEPFGTMAEVPSWIAEARASAKRVGSVEDAPVALVARHRDGWAVDRAVESTTSHTVRSTGVTLTVAPGELVGVVAARSANADALVTVLSGQLASRRVRRRPHGRGRRTSKASASWRPVDRCWSNPTGPTSSPGGCVQT